MTRNLYTTRGRSAIVDLLRQERRYLTATEVYRLLHSRGGVSLSTVYRTLELLAERGSAAVRTKDDGEAAYVACGGDHHHHAICRLCGHVEDVDCEAMEPFASALRRRHGFAIDAHAVEFYGRCAKCT